MTAAHAGQIPWLGSSGTDPSLRFQRIVRVHQAQTTLRYFWRAIDRKLPISRTYPDFIAPSRKTFDSHAAVHDGSGRLSPHALARHSLASAMRYVPKSPDTFCLEIGGTILKLWVCAPGRLATGLIGAGGALAVFGNTRWDTGTARRLGRGVGTALGGRPSGLSPCVYGSGT